MKTTLYFTTLLLSFLMHSQEQPTVLVNANYHNRNCAGGVGICADNGKIVAYTNANAVLYKGPDHHLIMKINLKNFSETETNALLLKKTFSVSGSKNLHLDSALLSKLNMDSHYSEIATGNYPVQFYANYVKINFILVQK